MSWLTSAGVVRSHSGGEVAGADQGEQSRGDGLGDVACRLAGRHVQGQLVHDALERVVATLASVALLAEAMLLFIAAVVG